VLHAQRFLPVIDYSIKHILVSEYYKSERKTPVSYWRYA